MSQADIIYNELIKNIYENGVWDKGENVRTVYADGTPAYSKSVFGVQVRFDKAIPPILTTKKVFWKTALKEMMLFWIHQTVKEIDFKNKNVKVWDEWFKDGNLGRSYAYQFESHRHHTREVVKVKPRIKEHHGELENIKVFDKIKPNYSNDDELIGKKFTSNNCGDAIVIDVYKSGEYYKKSIGVKIQFVDTNNISIIQKGDLLRGNFSDNFSRTVCGVGYKGNYKSVKNYKDYEVKHLYHIWNKMISRCYNKKDSGFKDYGGRGIFVDKRWHSFENFLRDVRYVPQFFLARENRFKKWHLDKDYYKSNCYSPDTCVWLEDWENVLYSREYGKPFYVESETGEKELFISLKDASLKYNFDKSHLAKSLKNCKKIKGYKVYYLDINDIYRYELSRNQVVELIKNIKENPQSRRLLSSFWNYADVDKKQLQECAWATDWNVKRGYLDLILIQRSADVGLGVVFNWIQYWFLQNMIAHVCGLKVGAFIHQIGNLHYYDKHEESLLGQIKNEQFEAPKIWINQEVKDFFDFTEDDVKLLDYNSGEYIKMEVAI